MIQCEKIIRDVEASRHNISKQENTKEPSKKERFMSSAICSSACQIAEQTKAKAIITNTYSGFNTITTSSFRPHAFIYAFTNNHSILNTLSLVWGVQGFYYDRGTTTSKTIKETKEILKESKLLKKGDLVINIASMPAHEKGMTNMMKISKYNYGKRINTKLLAEICEVAGAPGHEQRVREIVLREVKPLVDEIKIDNMGNVVAIKKGKEGKKRMIGAHMDEIDFIVTHIDDSGFVFFHTLGGFDPKTLTAQRVIIHGREDVIGVMGSKPIHLMSPEDRNKVPKIKDYFIDTGRSKKGVRKNYFCWRHYYKRKRID